MPPLLCRSPFFHACFPFPSARKHHANKEKEQSSQRKLFRLRSLRTSNTSFADPKRMSGGLSNNISIGVTYRAASKNSLPVEAPIRSACAILCLNNSWIGYLSGRWVDYMADRYGENAGSFKEFQQARALNSCSSSILTDQR